jgi:putative adhesin
MKRLHRSLACVALLAAAGALMAQESSGERVTASFSDPSRPGVLNVNLVAGSITVKAGQGKDVIIQSHGRREHRDADSEAASGGLRRLAQQPSIDIEEQNNRMEISSPSAMHPVDLEIEVPARTNLELSTVNNGDIHVAGIDGEMEIGNVNGSITLTSVSGSVVAHTVNGKVLVQLVRVTPQKPMAFTSLNGAVDITLPATTKAYLKLRSDNGEVYSDIELEMTTQAASVEDTRREGGRYRVEVNKSIYGTMNGGGPNFDLRTFNGNIYLRKGS